jgi:hypothetical protein
MKPHFDIAFLPQAEEFMDRLNDKAREKVYYNMKKRNLSATMSC